MTTLDLTEPDESLSDQLQRAVTRLVNSWPAGQTVNIGVGGEFGSSAKTTGVVAMAACLAQAGMITEIMDFDGQGNASKHLGFGVNKHPDDKLLDLNQAAAPLTVGDALADRDVYVPDEQQWRQVNFDDVRRCALNRTGIPGHGVITDPDDPDSAETREWLERLFIYPNGDSYASGHRRDFYSDELSLSQNPIGGASLMEETKKLSSCPHVRIWDLHGTKSLLMYAAFAQAKWLFTSVLLDDKTTGSDLDNLMRTIDEVRKLNAQLQLALIVPSRVKPASHRGKFGNEMLDRLTQRHGDKIAHARVKHTDKASATEAINEVPLTVRETVVVNEAYREREPLPMWVPEASVTDDYRRILLWGIHNNLFNP